MSVVLKLLHALTYSSIMEVLKNIILNVLLKVSWMGERLYQSKYLEQNILLFWYSEGKPIKIMKHNFFTIQFINILCRKYNIWGKITVKSFFLPRNPFFLYDRKICLYQCKVKFFVMDSCRMIVYYHIKLGGHKMSSGVTPYCPGKECPIIRAAKYCGVTAPARPPRTLTMLLKIISHFYCSA